MSPTDIADNLCKIYSAIARLEEKVIVLGRDAKAREEKTRSWLKWSIGTLISLISLCVAACAVVKLL